MPRGRWVDVAYPEESPSRNGVSLALHLDGRDLVGIRAVADEPVRRFAQQDLSRSGVLLETSGDVDGISRHERLPRGRVARHHPSGVHADVDADRDTTITFELLVQVLESVAHVDHGATSPERVVFMQLRDPEHGHHRVADVLLDRPSVAFDRRPHRVEVAGLDIAERLGIELLSQLRRARDVTEDDGDGLADLDRGCGRSERRRTGRTEREIIRALATTGLTCQHECSA